jgi:branched-chain amino acid transport system substrate-binding protein
MKTGVAVHLAATTLLALASLTLKAQAKEPITIVALYNLTGGGLASIDVPSLKGARLKAAMINEAGGLLDGRKINVIAIDTQNDTKAAALAARRAAAIDGVAAGIGQSDTDFALAAAPPFQARGIPFVTSGATSPNLPGMVGDRMFLVPFGDDVQAHAMAEYAYNTLGVRQIAVWTDEAMDYAIGLSKYFEKRFESLGGSIVVSGAYVTSDRDFSALVARLRANPDVEAVFASSGPDTAGILIKQIREAGLNIPILGGDGYDTDLVLSVPGRAFSDNVYFTTHAYAGLQTDAAKTFRSAYEKAYGALPENAFAALGYDAMGLVADAISRAASTAHEAVAGALASTSGYQGVTGKIIFRNGSRIPSKPVAIMSVNHGQVELRATVRPGE